MPQAWTEVSCSLYRSGSLATVARELARYHLYLVGVHEGRWDKWGTVRAGGFIIFFSMEKETKILFGHFNAKLGREDIFKPTNENDSLHQDSNDNGVRIVNLAASKNLVFRSTMFPHRNIHKYTWTSPDVQTYNQIYHILINRRWHLSMLNVRCFRGADCDTDHSLVVAKVREKLAVSKQTAQKF